MKIDITTLKLNVSELLQKHGVKRDDSEVIAEAIVETEAYGVSTHGLSMLKAHLRRIDNDGYNLEPNYTVEKETGTFSVINADNAIGFLSARFCMEYAVNKAKSTGIFVVFCKNANTYGAAFLYPLIASKQGCIGYTCCNSPATMTPAGGKTKLFGTNPFAFVIPSDPNPIIVDMATSKVAKSKFLQYKYQNKALPDGWAQDSEGNPTNDPDEAIRGSVCPMEGYKGYGIALIIDFIAGALSGAAYQDGVGRFYSETHDAMNVGQVFIAIDPKSVFGNGFDRMVQEYIQNIRNSESIDPGEPVIVPGDRKNSFKDKSVAEGIEVDELIYSLFRK